MFRYNLEMRRAGLLLVLAALLGGCAAGPAPLNEGVYQGTWANGEDAGVVRATIQNDSSPLFGIIEVNPGSRKVSFFAGCNDIQASISKNGLDDWLSTAMWCDDSFEPVFLENLTSGQFAIIDDSHFTVGDLLFSWRVPLGETIPFTGALLNGEYGGVLTVSDSVVASPLQLATATVINDGTMASFYAGCNRLRAPITETGLGPIASTRMLCPDDSKETLLLEHLNSGSFVKLSDSSFSVGDIVFTRVG